MIISIIKINDTFTFNKNNLIQARIIVMGIAKKIEHTIKFIAE